MYEMLELILYILFGVLCFILGILFWEAIVLLSENQRYHKLHKYILAGITFILLLLIIPLSCTVVDSDEVGIRFHKWSSNEQDYGGGEGSCKGWVFLNPITTDVFTYPTFTQLKQYDTFFVNAKDESLFEMNPTIAYRIIPDKACDIFTKYRVGVKELEDGYIKTCIYEAYRTCANMYTSDSLMSNQANFERDVRNRLEKSLMAEGFLVEGFTSKITPSKSLDVSKVVGNNTIKLLPSNNK